jgi:hypothetical protein
VRNLHFTVNEKCDGGPNMPQYKFISIKSEDGKLSNLSGSIRSHAIRAGLQKATYPSRGAKAAKTARSTVLREEPMFRFELHGGSTTPENPSEPSLVFTESTSLEDRNANAKSAPEIFPEVGQFNPSKPVRRD